MLNPHPTSNNLILQWCRTQITCLNISRKGSLMQLNAVSVLSYWSIFHLFGLWLVGWVFFFSWFSFNFHFFISWLSKLIKMQPMKTKKVKVVIPIPKLMLFLSVGGDCWPKWVFDWWSTGVLCVLCNPAVVFWCFWQAVPPVPSLLFSPRDSDKVSHYFLAPCSVNERMESLVRMLTVLESN